MERKRTNFKMYKIGRRWAFACAVILTMGTTTLVARADDGTTATGTDTASTSSSTTKSVTAKTQTLKTTATTEADVTNQNQPVLDTDGSNSKAAGTVAGTKAATDTDTNATTNLDETTSANTETGSDTTAGSKTAKETNATTGSESTKETSTTTDSATATAARTTTSSNKGATTDSATSNDTAATAAKTTDASAKIAGTTTSDSVAQQTTTTKDQSTTTATPQTVAVALSQAVTHANDAVADGGNVTDDYPDLHNMLGVSSQFHIFAREAELHAHTNGNVAVQNLVGNVNFGTNIIEELLDKDISYIQNISNIAGSSFVSAGETRSNKVIFGENIEIDVSNPNRPMVNGVYIDHLLASEVYQDKDGNVYIDFDKEFAKLEKLSASLSEASANATYTSDSFEDMNQRVIDMTDMQPDADGHIVINLSADVLNTSTPLTIKGLSADADGNTVIINVDTAGATNYQVNSQIKIIYDDGTERNNKETEDFGDNHLLWNFYDSTASDKLATGVISVDRPFQGSILAPAAEIDANQNIDGNIIANKVNVKAETHRWDLQDNVDNENDPEPVPDYEKPVHPSIDIEMPDNGEEEEEYDKPVHPSIDVEMPDFDEIEDEEEAEDAEEEFEDDIEDEIEAGVTPDEVVDQIEEEVDNEITADWVTDETATELETAFEEVQKEAVVGDQIKDEETLINLIDRAIAQAKAHHNTALVAQLQALRTKVASALAVAKGQALPQTDEAPSQMISLAGIALASTLVLGAAAVSRRKRRY
ncbi:collagen-binding domain-containing protein [Lactiplantibacillus plantarum]|uniref:collagen-binding domain-containing protein n=1 Tax=Lactiplantibacillus plantarum TaxID=1590 RepID=UPI000FF8C421|nr:collagen-binding domain-containing protein [Lactiplantibacillus plantarum]QAR90788.1 choice-of-anchor A family protein [Lactiplantibacillus plantarum]